MAEKRSVFSALMAECDKGFEWRREERRERRELSPAELRELYPMAYSVVYGVRHD